MKIKITAGGIYGGDGKEIPLGTEMDFKDEPTGWAGRYTVLSGGKDSGDKTAVTNPKLEDQKVEFVAPEGPFTVVERSPGWWGISDGNGEPVGKNVRKGDLDGFDGLSDEDKLAYATDHAKAAA